MQEVKFVDLGKQYLSLREEILTCFDTISRRGSYILSEELERFECCFAEYCGTKFAIGVASGSDALHLSLLALGIGPGDEVITVPNSFIATAWVIARTGARPVFVDVGDDMNIDPDLIEPAITDNTRAILPVHFTGRPVRMDAIEEITRARNLYIIEDAAQAVGARWRGRRTGSLGHCAGFSLHPLKNLHVHGDGGVITTDDTALHETLLKYRNHGLANRDECEFWGVNSRLDSIQAGIAEIKLKYLDKWNARYREIAAIYSERLADYVDVPRDREEEEPTYHRYMIRHLDRDRLQFFLAENGIETKVNYPIPLHLHPAASQLGYKAGDFPVAERLAETILSLPLYPELEEQQIDYVTGKIVEYSKKHSLKAPLQAAGILS